ncbi:MAG: PilT/PilU family type 4a pilus ATPase [Thermoleophilia bacterium]
MSETLRPATRLSAILAYAVKRGASDVHLKVPAKPVLRIDGRLVPINEHPPLTPEDTVAFANEVLDAADSAAKRTEFQEMGDVDLSHAAVGIGRFRVNMFRQRGSVSMVLRVVPFSVKTLDELHLPPAVAKLASEERGVILVTGTTGSGKSTTLAAMIDQVNRTEHKHVVTIEDPIEMLHTDQRSVINQREVGLDTQSFVGALRRVLRQDPDVIMIGEIRDLTTMEVALSAAETGHLVLSTMHTLDATETINRAIGFYPLHQQMQVRAMLAGTLKGIISQRLVPRSDVPGRVAAAEIMIATGRARDMITNPDDTGRIHELIRDGEYYGMQTFDQSLFDHVQAGRVALDEAIRHASSPHDFKLMLDAGMARRDASLYS